MSERVLTRRALNRALLERQLLLDRGSLSVPAAVEQVGGLQTQYAPSGYVGLWTRLAGFERDALTAALEDRSVVQATLMRTTIHIVSRREFWAYATAIRRARREWALRVAGTAGAPDGEAGMAARAERLRAFGPASWRDIASWAGVSVADSRRGGEGVSLVHYRDEDGRPLVDLDGAALPDGATPAPVRFLPHWDASLLVHARRTGILPEAHRPRVFNSKNPFSVGTYLVDGVVAGAWSVRNGRVELYAFEDLSTADRRAVELEREALEAFHA